MAGCETVAGGAAGGSAVAGAGAGLAGCAFAGAERNGHRLHGLAGSAAKLLEAIARHKAIAEPNAYLRVGRRILAFLVAQASRLCIDQTRASATLALRI